ncbi:LysR family transcriptional regulator [Achromobacter aloeverae]
MSHIRLPATGSLIAFEAAARHLNFRLAAGELHLTPSAISQQIRVLEQQIGVALFARVRQRVLLTSAGERYLHEVRRILRDLREVTYQALASGDKEWLNLAVVPTFAVKWLIPRLPDFVARHPEVHLNIVSRSAPFDFAHEAFDAAIHYGEAVWPGAQLAHLMDEEMTPVCSRALQERLGIYAPADLLRVPLLQQFTRPSSWNDWFEHLAIVPANAFEGPRFDSFNMILEAVRAGMGAALLPRFMIDEAADQLVRISDVCLPSRRGYHLAWPTAKSELGSVRKFQAWLSAQASESGLD